MTLYASTSSSSTSSLNPGVQVEGAGGAKASSEAQETAGGGAGVPPLSPAASAGQESPADRPVSCGRSGWCAPWEDPTLPAPRPRPWLWANQRGEALVAGCHGASRSRHALCACVYSHPFARWDGLVLMVWWWWCCHGDGRPFTCAL